MKTIYNKENKYMNNFQSSKVGWGVLDPLFDFIHKIRFTL